MTQPAGPPAEDRVSRRRYEREKRARLEAEGLLEAKSRELWEANQQLKTQAANLEDAVRLRTEELEQATQQAQSASAAKSSFLAMISHEIRTPLNGVLGMASVLAESELPDDQHHMAEVILTSGQSLLELLNDVLDLSKIEAGKMEVESRRFDLHALCRQIEELFGARALGKGLRFSFVIAPEVPRFVVCDPTRVRQVLSNLLSNAIKFTARGEVSARVGREGPQLSLTVLDSGPGVPEEKRAGLFEAFVQTDSSITRKFGGTGLGLAISRNICRIMGGDLIYVLRPEGGSCFAGRVGFTEAEAEARETSDSADAAEVQRVLTALPWRVLVAEDSLTNQKVLRLLLRPYALDLTMVEDGAAAVERHCAAPFDLILMDVNMPVMNGLEAAALIREAEGAHGLPHVPIIALTANAMTHQVSDYLQQGIDAHVAKPVKREILAARMAKFLHALLPTAEIDAGKERRVPATQDSEAGPV